MTFVLTLAGIAAVLAVMQTKRRRQAAADGVGGGVVECAGASFAVAVDDAGVQRVVPALRASVPVLEKPRVALVPSLYVPEQRQTDETPTPVQTMTKAEPIEPIVEHMPAAPVIAPILAMPQRKDAAPIHWGEWIMGRMGYRHRDHAFADGRVDAHAAAHRKTRTGPCLQVMESRLWRKEGKRRELRGGSPCWNPTSAACR